ncbi:MAG: ROK family protein [Bacteroidales bacterium]|nr:ROK family protein [Bacteroidales bacterium]
MGIISSLIKLGLIAGASITAYQASEKAKQETGTVKGDAFVKNFTDLAVQNTKLVVDSVKSMVGGKQDGGYRYSDKGENGYTYVDAEPAEGKAGDKAALEVFDEYTEHLAVGLVNIINFIDPEVIAIGGGVSAAGEFLVKPVREKLAKKIFYKTMPYARVELATLGNDAGIIGAAMLGK